MVYLWPHLREQIDSIKTPEEIYMILQSVTDSRKAFLFSDAEFRGRVDPLNFRINRLFYGRNSFEAVLTGNLIKKEGGTAIEVTLQMHTDTCIFLTIWNVIDCFIVLFTILAVFTGNLEEKCSLWYQLLLLLGVRYSQDVAFMARRKKLSRGLRNCSVSGNVFPKEERLYMHIPKEESSCIGLESFRTHTACSGRRLKRYCRPAMSFSMPVTLTGRIFWTN